MSDNSSETRQRDKPEAETKTAMDILAANGMLHPEDYSNVRASISSYYKNMPANEGIKDGKPDLSGKRVNWDTALRNVDRMSDSGDEGKRKAAAYSVYPIHAVIDMLTEKGLITTPNGGSDAQKAVEYVEESGTKISQAMFLGVEAVEKLYSRNNADKKLSEVLTEKELKGAKSYLERAGEDIKNVEDMTVADFNSKAHKAFEKAQEEAKERDKDFLEKVGELLSGAMGVGTEVMGFVLALLLSLASPDKVVRVDENGNVLQQDENGNWVPVRQVSEQEERQQPPVQDENMAKALAQFREEHPYIAAPEPTPTDGSMNIAEDILTFSGRQKEVKIVAGPASFKDTIFKEKPKHVDVNPRDTAEVVMSRVGGSGGDKEEELGIY